MSGLSLVTGLKCRGGGRESAEQNRTNVSSERPAISGRAKAVIALLVVQLAVTIASALVTVVELGLLQRAQRGERVTFAEAEASDDRVAMVGVVWLVSWLVAGIVWLTWQHRAHRQLRQLGTQGLQFTPGWGVGWWFVPVANFWKPYQAIKELWVASDPEKGASDWRGGKAWTVLPWWWAAWLISGFLAWGTLGMDPETVDEFISRDYASIAEDLAWVLAGLLAIAIVRGIDRRLSLISSWAPRRPDLPAPPE
jgi:hypothetical protein